MIGIFENLQGPFFQENSFLSNFGQKGPKIVFVYFFGQFEIIKTCGEDILPAKTIRRDIRNKRNVQMEGKEHNS